VVSIARFSPIRVGEDTFSIGTELKRPMTALCPYPTSSLVLPARSESPAPVEDEAECRQTAKISDDENEGSESKMTFK